MLSESISKPDCKWLVAFWGDLGKEGFVTDNFGLVLMVVVEFGRAETFLGDFNASRFAARSVPGEIGLPGAETAFKVVPFDGDLSGTLEGLFGELATLTMGMATGFAVILLGEVGVPLAEFIDLVGDLASLLAPLPFIAE